MGKTYTKALENAIREAQKAAKKMSHDSVGSEHLLLGILIQNNNAAAKVLEKHKLDASVLAQVIENNLTTSSSVATKGRLPHTLMYDRVLELAESEAGRTKSVEVGTEHVLLAILRMPECIAYRVMLAIKLDLRRIYLDLREAMGLPSSEAKKEFNSVFKNAKPKKSATQILDRYSRDMTKLAREGRLDPVVGREEEIKRVIQILSRRMKNNPCLIGEPGVGKTAIVEGLAALIASGQVPETVRGKRLLSLDLTAMVAGTKYRGEFEERIKRVIEEVCEDSNIILFVDEVHTLIGAGGAEGAMDASNILKPALSRGELQMIGATTTSEYRKHIEKDAALERRFQPVVVEEPTKEEALLILEGIRHIYEEHHGVTISDAALEAAVSLSERYINDRYLPDKAIDLIDETCSRKRIYTGYSGTKKPENLSKEIELLNQQIEEYLIGDDLEGASACRKRMEELMKKQETAESKKNSSKKSGKKLSVDEHDIAEVVSIWTKIPLSKLEEKELKRLQKLSDILHKRVIGQSEAVDAVAKAIRRGRVGLKNPKRPIGSFLFLGPTGVGKTELSKALAEALFGDENALIRVDMSEYMEKYSVSKLIGSPPGYVGFEEGGQFSEKVRRNPYSVILFDEVEKADPDIFNVLLQVLDDGHITDSQGRKVDFKNTVIIMTSNAGAGRIMEPKQLGFISKEDKERDHQQMKDGVMEEVKRIFKPEFLNRIDETIVFHMLTEEEIHEIIDLLMRELTNRVKEQMDITLKYDKKVKDFIFKEGYDKKYGARPLRRAILNHIEDGLADCVLSGKIKAGDSVRISIKSDKPTFTPVKKKTSSEG